MDRRTKTLKEGYSHITHQATNLMLFNLIYTLLLSSMCQCTQCHNQGGAHNPPSTSNAGEKGTRPRRLFLFPHANSRPPPLAPASRKSWSTAHADAKGSSIPPAPTQAERSLKLEADLADAHPFPMPPLRLPILYKYPIDRRLLRQP